MDLNHWKMLLALSEKIWEKLKQLNPDLWLLLEQIKQSSWPVEQSNSLMYADEELVQHESIFLEGSDKEHSTGVLLGHDLLATPKQMKIFAERLQTETCRICLDNWSWNLRRRFIK